MELKLDFEDSGFNNNVIKSDPNYVHLKTNVKNEDDAWRWKAILEKKNNILFNAAKILKRSCAFITKNSFVCMARNATQEEKHTLGKCYSFTFNLVN